MKITVQHDQKNQKYYAMIDGQEAFLKYNEIPGKKIWDFHHTFVPPALRGRHIAEDIVIYALDDAKAKNYQIIPSCPFVQRIIDRHPEYKPLVADIF